MALQEVQEYKAMVEGMKAAAANAGIAATSNGKQYESDSDDDDDDSKELGQFKRKSSSGAQQKGFPSAA